MEKNTDLMVQHERETPAHKAADRPRMNFTGIKGNRTKKIKTKPYRANFEALLKA